MDETEKRIKDRLKSYNLEDEWLDNVIHGMFCEIHDLVDIISEHDKSRANDIIDILGLEKDKK